MAFDYDKTAATALRLITKFGASSTLTHVAPATYDPTTGSTTPTETAQTVQACVFPYSNALIDGTLIRTTDLQALVAASGVSEPAAGSTLLWGGVTRTIVRAKNLGPAGTFVLYELQVRTQ
jgi:hypothetical protein